MSHQFMRLQHQHAQRSRRDLAFAIIAVLGSGILFSGCALIEADGTECHFQANNPHHSAGSPGFIVGKAQFSCKGTKTPSSVIAVVKIQREVGSRWIDVARTERPRVVSPFFLNLMYVAQTGEMRCTTGVFRTAVRGSGVLAGVERSSAAWQYSQTARNPCD